MPNDLYSRWLDVPAGPRPPDCYRLLGLGLFCADAARIEQAAQDQLDRLAHCALSGDAATYAACERMREQVVQAHAVLTDLARKAAYDRYLAAKLGVEPPEDLPLAMPVRAPHADEEALPRARVVEPSGVAGAGGRLRAAWRRPWGIASAAAAIVVLGGVLAWVFWPESDAGQPAAPSGQGGGGATAPPAGPTGLERDLARIRAAWETWPDVGRTGPIRQAHVRAYNAVVAAQDCYRRGQLADAARAVRAFDLARRQHEQLCLAAAPAAREALKAALSPSLAGAIARYAPDEWRALQAAVAQANKADLGAARALIACKRAMDILRRAGALARARGAEIKPTPPAPPRPAPPKPGPTSGPTPGPTSPKPRPAPPRPTPPKSGPRPTPKSPLDMDVGKDETRRRRIAARHAEFEAKLRRYRANGLPDRVKAEWAAVMFAVAKAKWAGQDEAAVAKAYARAEELLKKAIDRAAQLAAKPPTHGPATPGPVTPAPLPARPPATQPATRPARPPATPATQPATPSVTEPFDKALAAYRPEVLAKYSPTTWASAQGLLAQARKLAPSNAAGAGALVARAAALLPKAANEIRLRGPVLRLDLKLSVASPITDMQFSARGDLLVASEVHKLQLWGLAKRGGWLTSMYVTMGIPRVLLSPDGKEVICVSSRRVQRFETATGRQVGEFPSRSGSLYRSASIEGFSPRGELALAGARAVGGQSLQLYRTRSGKAVGTGMVLPRSTSWAGRCFSPDERFLAVVDPGSYAAYVWDTQTGTSRRLDGQRPMGRPLVSPNSRWVAIQLVNPENSNKRALQVWSAETGKPAVHIPLPTIGGADDLRLVAFSPDSRGVLVEAWSPHTKRAAYVLYDLKTRRSRGRVLSAGRPSSLLFSPDGTRVAMLLTPSGGRDFFGRRTRKAPPKPNHVGLWNAAPLAPIKTDLRFDGDGVTLQFSGDSRVLAVSTRGQDITDRAEVHLIDAATGTVAVRRQIPQTDAYLVRFDPTGRVLAVARSNQTVELWDLDPARRHPTIPARAVLDAR